MFCSYNKLKYDHEFYLQYDKDSGRWNKALPSIQQGNKRICVSGFYKGYSSMDNEGKVYHRVQLTELDFEPKYSNKSFDDVNDDDDELFFGTSSISKKSMSTQKHNLSDSESTDESEDTKRKAKKLKKVKHTNLKQEFSYEQLPKQKNHQHNQSQSDKRNVQFNLPEENDTTQSDVSSGSNKRGGRGRRGRKTSEPTRKSPRKGKGSGILKIAVKKVVDDEEESEQLKSDSLMDTESDYQTQNEEEEEEEE